LIDFGLGQKQLNSDFYCGTVPYMAPEVMKNGTYTKSVDIWSIGIIMHIILTGGKHPLYDK
jgi:serine/threonine protein kinase